MTKTEATAEVFWTAFKGLPPREKRAVIRRIVQNRKLRQDLMDLSVIESRKAEPVRPLRKYLQESR